MTERPSTAAGRALRYREHRDETTSGWSWWRCVPETELIEARAECDALRAALERIYAEAVSRHDYGDSCVAIARTASAALAGSADESNRSVLDTYQEAADVFVEEYGEALRKLADE